MNTKKEIGEKLDYIEMISSILSGGMDYLTLSFDNSVKSDDTITNDIIYILNDFAKKVSIEISDTLNEIREGVLHTWKK